MNQHCFLGKGYGVNFLSISQAHSEAIGDLSSIWESNKQVNLQPDEGSLNTYELGEPVIRNEGFCLKFSLGSTS